MINWDAFNYDRVNKVFWIEDSEVTSSSRELLEKIGRLEGDLWKIDREKLGFEYLSDVELIKEMESRFVGFIFYGVRGDNSDVIKFESGHPILLKGLKAAAEEEEEEEEEED